MRTTLMQRMASGVAMSTVLAIGHSASDEERVGATGQAWSRLEGVTLTRVLGADPTGLEIPGEHVSAGPPPAGAVMAVGQRASADEPDAAQAGSRHEGIVLPRVVRADPARLDLRGASASAGLLTRDAGGAQPAWLEAREDRDRRMGLGVLIGAGIGGALGALTGAGWGANEGGGHCPLTFGFGALGALAGGGIGGVLGALGGK